MLVLTYIFSLIVLSVVFIISSIISGKGLEEYLQSFSYYAFFALFVAVLVIIYGKIKGEI